MNELPDQIFRRWGHSFEEDKGDVTVYRPAEYEFPRARGRASIELRPDGTFIDWTIGAADAPQPVTGRWRTEAPGRIHVLFEGGVRPPRSIEILHCHADVLRLRQTVAS